MTNKSNSGFTLLELIVVIAIIGIFAALIIFSLSNQRTKAKIASTQTTMDSIIPIVVSCLDNGSLINNTVVGELICDAEDSPWPELTSGWVYGSDPVSNIESNTFFFSASDSLGNQIACDEINACVTTLAI